MCFAGPVRIGPRHGHNRGRDREHQQLWYPLRSDGRGLLYRTGCVQQEAEAELPSANKEKLEEEKQKEKNEEKDKKIVIEA